MRTAGRPSGSTVASAIDDPFRTEAFAAASHSATSGSGLSGKGSGRAGVIGGKMARDGLES